MSPPQQFMLLNNGAESLDCFFYMVLVSSLSQLSSSTHHTTSRKQRKTDARGPSETTSTEQEGQAARKHTIQTARCHKRYIQLIPHSLALHNNNVTSLLTHSPSQSSQQDLARPCQLVTEWVPGRGVSGIALPLPPQRSCLSSSTPQHSSPRARACSWSSFGQSNTASCGSVCPR